PTDVLSPTYQRILTRGGSGRYYLRPLPGCHRYYFGTDRSHRQMLSVWLDSGLSKDTTMRYGEEDLYTCIYTTAKKQRNSISFSDKVDCAVRVGFVQSTYAEEIKQLYALRNLAHIETEAEKQMEVEIDHSKKAYWRM